MAEAPEISIEYLEQLAPKVKRASELPDRFVATIENAELREDSTGRTCLYVRLRLRDGSITVTKYTPMHLADLAECLRKMGFKTVNEAIGKTFAFVKRHFRIGYPRPMPVEVLPERGERE